MLSRRTFLQLIPSLTFPFFLSSCGQISPVNLNMLFLNGSLPPQLIAIFKREFASNMNINFKPVESLNSIFSLLKKAPQDYQGDLFTLGNYWLAQAIEENLLMSLESNIIPQWQQLPSQLQELITAEKGKIWGVPYRWGCTVIAYRRDLLEKEKITPPTDWQELWQEKLKGKIGLLNQPREIIGLTLKKLGYSYNSDNLKDIRNLKLELLKLDQQVKFYSSNAYIQPLLLGDVSLVVGWSGDLYPLKKPNPNLEIIIPKSGTSLWCEIWGQPKNNLSLDNNKTNLINQWLNYCLTPQAASQIALFTSATSPIISIVKPEEILPEIFNNNLLNPEPEILKKSEFINALPKSIEQEYIQLWQGIKQ